MIFETSLFIYSGSDNYDNCHSFLSFIRHLGMYSTTNSSGISSHPLNQTDSVTISLSPSELKYEFCDPLSP